MIKAGIPVGMVTSSEERYKIKASYISRETRMDIEAISGPRVSEPVLPMRIGEEVEPVWGTGPVLAAGWDVRDRVTISREARQRYEAALASRRKDRGEGR